VKARRPRPQGLITDPRRPQPYRLRLARYEVLAQDISLWAGAAAGEGRSLNVLDVGCGWGVLLHHLEAQPHFPNIAMSAADLTDTATYKTEFYRDYFIGDLTGGYPGIGSERYDVVVCEQVLEHLDALDTAIATLARIVRPGGRLVIGVPIFFPPLHLARKYLVPPLARILRHSASASHQQAFSLYSFRRLLGKFPGLSIEAARGFRIVSGGILRPLENYRWWWQFNRRLGELVPALCIEVQFILRKSAASPL
jgi:SAM-dependent methyltransferase